MVEFITEKSKTKTESMLEAKELLVKANGIIYDSITIITEEKLLSAEGIEAVKCAYRLLNMMSNLLN